MRAIRLAKCWVSAFIVIGLLAVPQGCQSTPAMGPVYKLRTAEIPEPTTPVAVSVSDNRPTTERQFHPGAVDPIDYENAVDVLTLDNFDPDPINLLKKSLAAQLSTLSEPPTWAEVDLDSFRVTVNRCAIMEVEYERQKRMGDSQRMVEHDRLNRQYQKELKEYHRALKVAKAHRQPLPDAPKPPPNYIKPSMAPGVGIGVGMSAANGNGFGGVVGGIGAGLIAAAIVSDLEDQRPAVKHAAGTDSASGVTCQLAMRVRLHWPDNRREEFQIKTETHTPPPGDGAQEVQLNSLKMSVIPTVQQALEQAGVKLASQATVFLEKAPDPGQTSRGGRSSL